MSPGASTMQVAAGQQVMMRMHGADTATLATRITNRPPGGWQRRQHDSFSARPVARPHIAPPQLGHVTKKSRCDVALMSKSH